MDRATGMGDRGTDSEMGRHKMGERNLEAREPSSVEAGSQRYRQDKTQTDRQTDIKEVQH